MADEEAGQQAAMSGQGNQPEGTGYAPPDTGESEIAESEIPVGVDSVEAKDPPEDPGEGGSAAIDLANLDVGDADTDDADAGGEAGADAEAEADAGDAEPEAEGGDAEPEAEGEAAPA